MARKKATPDVAPVAPVAVSDAVSHQSLANALVAAINMAKPKEKKTVANRTVGTPWSPKDGSPKLKLKRKMHQHGLLLDADLFSNEEIDLMNKVRPGVFLDGHVQVIRRKDRGIDISYPIKTASQRLRLLNSFGIRDFKELLQKLINEAENPVKKIFDADGDAY